MATPSLSRRPLFQLSVSVPEETEDAVATLLESIFHQSPILSTDEATRLTEVSLFFRRSAEGTPERLRKVDVGLALLRRAGLPVGRARPRWRPLRPENWATSWKRHFKPLEIGRVLLIRPSWSRRRPVPGQVEVVLDPGLSFGTGQHPTTRFCLEQIVAGRSLGQPPSLLDVGTGSGLLAIAAAKLGYRPVHAFDLDSEAVQAARANAAANGLEAALQLRQSDLTRLGQRSRQQFDIVCANLQADLLLRESERLEQRVAPAGWLVLAGILRTEFRKVRAAYQAAGFRLLSTKAETEWQSGCFRRRYPGAPSGSLEFTTDKLPGAALRLPPG